MATTTNALATLPDPGSELAISVGMIADRLMRSIRDGGGEIKTNHRALLERALAVAAEAEQRLAEQSRQISLLEALTMTDEVTGLLNRRGFDHEFSRVLAGARRYDETGVLAFIDLDDFKTINDVHGHAAGDRVLHVVGQVLLGQIRECDVVARIGGDEFAVVLSKCTTKNGHRRATEFRNQVNDVTVAYGGSVIPVRASIGTTTFDGEAEIAELLCRADNAMYARKRGNGRQHVRTLETSLEHGRFNGAAE